MSSAAWGQGGRGRGAPTAPAAQAGRGAVAAGSGGTGEFYSYDPTAGSGIPISDAAPAETHQKITVNGQALAYTARAGYLPLRNATTGQSEAHLFYTCYSKDGVTEASSRPVMFFMGGAPGVCRRRGRSSAAWVRSE